MAKKSNEQSARKELLAEVKEEQIEKVRAAELLLAEEKESRSRQFLAEMQDLCKKYRCEIVPMFQVKAH